MQISFVIGSKVIKVTPSELRELYWNTKKMIEWDVDGGYGDGGEIIDKKGLRVAHDIIKKLTPFFNA